MAVKLSADASGFKREMDAAARSVRELSNQSKLADSELRKTGDTQSYVTQKTAALTRQIEEQQRAVSAAERGLAAAAKQYGENSAQVQTWQSRLAAARTALNNFQADLRDVQSGTDRMQRSLQGGTQATRELGQVANATKFTAFQSALNGVEQKLNSVSATARRLGQAIWRTATESAEWADTLATNASRYGIDTRTLQQWEYAARFVDVEASTIAAASNRLISAVSSNSQALANLGVHARTATGEMRSTQDVFWDAVEALGRMTDETERDARAQEIFGRSFAELRPLIDAGRQSWEEYCDEAERAGIILSETQTQGLLSFNDSLDRMRATMSGLTHGVMAELAPGFAAISDTVTEAAQSILEWTRTAEGQQAIDNLTQSIQQLVHSMADGGLQALISGITDAITALGNAANWAAQHSDALMPLLGLAVGGRTVGNLAIGGLRIANGVKNLLGLGSGAAAAGGAASGGGLLSTLGGIFTSSAGVGALGLTAGIGSMAGLAYLAREAGTVHHASGAEIAAQRTQARLAAMGVQPGQYAITSEEAQAAYRRQQEAEAARQEEVAAQFQEAGNELVEGWRQSNQQDQASESAWRARQQEEWARNRAQDDITAAIEAARLRWSGQGSSTQEEPEQTEIQAQVQVTSDAITLSLSDGELSLHEFNGIVRYVNEQLTPAVEAARALIADSWTEVLRDMNTWPTAEELMSAKPRTERQALEFLAMTNFVQDAFDTDLTNATKLAANLWTGLVATVQSPEALNVKLGSMTGEQAYAANDETFTAMVNWVEQTMDVDHDRAVVIAKQMWDDLNQTATNPGELDGDYNGSTTPSTAFTTAVREIFGEDYETAMNMVKGMWNNVTGAATGGTGNTGSTSGWRPTGGSNPNTQSTALKDDIQRLGAIRDEIQEILGHIEEEITEEVIVSMHLDPESEARLLALLGEAERVAGRIAWYQSPEATAGAGAYETVLAGLGDEEDLGEAYAYLEQMREHELQEIDTELDRLSSEYQRLNREENQLRHRLTTEEGMTPEQIAENAEWQQAHAATEAAREAKDAAVAGRAAARLQVEQDYMANVANLFGAVGVGKGYTGERTTAEAQTVHVPTWEEYAEEHGIVLDNNGQPLTESEIFGEGGLFETGANGLYAAHRGTGSAWYGAEDSAAAQLAERFNHSLDELLSAADTDEALGDWLDGMLETIREGGENAGLYDAIMEAAFGDAWTQMRPSLTGRASVERGTANTRFDSVSGYNDPYLNALMGILGYEAGSTQVRDITDVAKAAAEYNEAVRLYQEAAAEAQRQADEAAARQAEEAAAGGADFDTLMRALIASGAIDPTKWNFSGGNYGPLENWAAENGFGHGAMWSESNIYRAGEGAAQGFAGGIESGTDAAADAATNMAEAAIEAVEEALDEHSPSKVTMQLGKYMVDGLALGIRENKDTAVSAAREVALAVAEAMRAALDIHSPSQVMAALGAYVGEGFALGIASTVDQVQAAVYGMAAGTMAPLAGAAAGGSTYNTSSALYVDKFYNNSGDDIAYINEQLATLQQQQARGRGKGR